MFVVGGLSYGGLEVICRGHTFISMGMIGGICMAMIHILNDERRKNMIPAYVTVSISWVFIVSAELVSGEILNRMLRLHIWSYSKMRFNFDGQICLLFSLLWFGLAFVGLMFDEFLMAKLFHRPHVPLGNSKQST